MLATPQITGSKNFGSGKNFKRPMAVLPHRKDRPFQFLQTLA